MRSQAARLINEWAKQNPLDRSSSFERRITEGLRVVFERIEGMEGGLRQRLEIVYDPILFGGDGIRLGETVLQLLTKRSPVFLKHSHFSPALRAVITLPRGPHEWSLKVIERRFQVGSRSDLVPTGAPYVVYPD